MNYEAARQLVLRLIPLIISISHGVSGKKNPFYTHFRVELQTIDTWLRHPLHTKISSRIRRLLYKLERICSVRIKLACWGYAAWGLSVSIQKSRPKPRSSQNLLLAIPTLRSLLSSEKARSRVRGRLEQIARRSPRSQDEILERLRRFSLYISVEEYDGIQEEVPGLSQHFYGLHTDVLWNVLCKVWTSDCSCASYGGSIQGPSSGKHILNLLLAARRPIIKDKVDFDLQISRCPVGSAVADINEWQDTLITVPNPR